MEDARQGIDVREGDTRSKGTAPGRPFLQILFRCSGIYQRVYRNRAGDAYEARCPKCAKAVRFRVGPGGSEQRAFEVDCR